MPMPCEIIIRGMNRGTRNVILDVREGLKWGMLRKDADEGSGIGRRWGMLRKDTDESR